MSLHNSIAAPASLLQASSQAFAAISENIINVSTVGYKQRNVTFNEVLYKQESTGSSPKYSGVDVDIGFNLGVTGTALRSNRETDFALTNNGFFITNKRLDKRGAYLLTQAGSFDYETQGDVTVDYASYLIDSNGNYLLGWGYDENTGLFGESGSQQLLSSLNPINVRGDVSLMQDAEATSKSQLLFNVPYGQGDLSYTFNHGLYDGTSTSSFDDDRYHVGMEWLPAEDENGDRIYNQWEVQFVPGYGNNRTKFKHDSSQDLLVTFNANGSVAKVEMLNPEDPENAELDITNIPIVFAGQNFDKDNPNNSGDLSVVYDFTNITNFHDNVVGGTLVDNGSLFNGNSWRQVNYLSLSLHADGTLVSNFEHGISQTIARIPMAYVYNPNAMIAHDGQSYQPTDLSGDIRLFDLSTAGVGVFEQYALTQSDTSLVGAFTSMIHMQKTYNSGTTLLRSIDEMIRTVTELKK